MQFESLSDFFHMGGYAFYVWLSFGSCAFILLGLVWASLNDAKRIKREVDAQMKREARIKQAQEEAQA
ncbi:heme exporter protein CcmD [Pseudoalteromonas rubra]|uniref:Heme exporter protein D n=1 Tax=Pseudoalteromonas rubra TaxID=43658 RepID=A0A0F4QYF1_9GAMM|nr:heme exporter protein CcmD [Pseudoalteromonas rubra]KJZ11612.1 heme exporter protein D [Pseudoalteromonas rubra]